MNVFALKGHKIKVAERGFEAGYDLDKPQALKLLQEDKIYTVEKTDVSRSSSRVWLQEIPGKVFNTVHFEDVTQQSFEDDKKHPDFQKFVRAGIFKL